MGENDLPWSQRSWPGQTIQVFFGHVKDSSPSLENEIKALKSFPCMKVVPSELWRIDYRRTRVEAQSL